MKRKKALALLLALTTTAGCLAGCGNTADTDTDAAKDSSQTTTEAASTESDAPESEAEEFDPRSVCEGVVLTIAVADQQEVIDYNTNEMTLRIEEELGVDLQFEAYAAADFLDKVNVMVNGGDKLPDMIWGSGGSGLNGAYESWAAEEVLLPLNEYYENPDYAVNINAACERAGVDIPSLLKDADGNIWAAPKYFQFPTDTVANKLWINEEYAKKLGFEEVPTTTEGFYELCKAFAAAGDVNENGRDDEVCFTGNSGLAWFKMLMSPYVYAWDNYYLDVTNDQLSFAYTTDAWKEGLKYVKKFMDEGLIDTSALTQDSTAYKAIAADPDAGLLASVGYYPQMINDDKILQYKARLMYKYLPGLAGPEGRVEAYYAPVTANAGAVITVDCENPEAAFLVLDYLCREDMSLSNRYGGQGEDWDYWEEVDTSKFTEGITIDNYEGRLKDEYPTPKVIAYSDGSFWSSGNPQNRSLYQHGPAIQSMDLYWGIAIKKDLSDEKGQLAYEYNNLYVNSIVDTLDWIPEEHVTRLPMTAEEMETTSEIQVTLDNYVLESIGAFLTGQWDIDADWDTYISELQKIGYEEALEIYQTAYDRTK